MIEALITGGVAILVCMINNFYQHKAVEEKHNETISLIEYKLEQLEKKQDKHNCVVERLYEVEQRLGIDEEKLKVVNHRIEDLEEK